MYGDRTFDSRNNVKWTKNDTVVYHKGALGIVLDPDKNKQSYFIRHSEDIVSLAIDPSGTIAATGQLCLGGKDKLAPIYMWDIETQKVLGCLKGFHRQAVRFVIYIIYYSYDFHLMECICYLLVKMMIIHWLYMIV